METLTARYQVQRRANKKIKTKNGKWLNKKLYLFNGRNRKLLQDSSGWNLLGLETFKDAFVAPTLGKRAELQSGV